MGNKNPLYVGHFAHATHRVEVAAPPSASGADATRCRLVYATGASCAQAHRTKDGANSIG